MTKPLIDEASYKIYKAISEGKNAEELLSRNTNMRLIDANEVKRFYEEEFPDLDNGVHWSRNDIICNLDNIPTVKVITAEWITDWLAKQTVPATSYGLDRSAIEKMLDDWEAENE